MNIVYGVSGEGLGHVFEAIQVAARLRALGHQVKVLTYGERALDSLAAFAPTRIEGINLVFDEDGMSIGGTTKRNLHILGFFWRNWSRLRRELEAFRPDVFLTAYEPYTMIMAHVLRRPLVSMDNQNELLHLPRPKGAKWMGFRVVQLATMAATHGADVYVIKTYARSRPDSRRFRFVDPLIQEEIQQITPSVGDHVVVYLTKPNPPLIAVLRSLPDRFIVYCHDQTGEDGNVTYRRRGPTFLPDLASARAIIATTGFSLIADALYLGKPYFGVPLRRQFEQAYNARFLAQAGFGAFSESPTRAEIATFLEHLPDYRAKLLRSPLNPRQQLDVLLGVLAELERAGLHRPPIL